MTKLEDQAAVRRALRAWLDRHGWSVDQIAQAVRVSIKGRPAPTRTIIAALLRDGEVINRMARELQLFLDANPAPGSYSDWQDRVVERAHARMDGEMTEIAVRAEQVERERAARRASLLAAERRPVERTWFPSQRWIGRYAEARTA